MATETAARPTSGAKTDEDLIKELTPGMRDLLHDRARQHYYVRILKAMFFFMFLPFFLAMSATPAGRFLPDFTPVERNIFLVMALAIFGYLAFGFALVWPERSERKLLQKEIEYRRLHGKWRWER